MFGVIGADKKIKAEDECLLVSVRCLTVCYFEVTERSLRLSWLSVKNSFGFRGKPNYRVSRNPKLKTHLLLTNSARDSSTVLRVGERWKFADCCPKWRLTWLHQSVPYPCRWMRQRSLCNPPHPRSRKLCDPVMTRQADEKIGDPSNCPAPIPLFRHSYMDGNPDPDHWSWVGWS